MFVPQLPITGDIQISDTVISNKIRMEINFLLNSVLRNKSIFSIQITPVLDSVMDLKGKRFGLILVTNGFTRTNSNYTNQSMKGAGMAILTLGMYYQTPIKATSNIYAMIVDAKENNIAFFNKDFVRNKEPLEATVIIDQFKNLFSGYFFPTTHH